MAILAWGLVYLAFGVVFYGLLMGPMLADLIGGYQDMARSAAEGRQPDPAAMLAMQSRMMGVQPLIFLGSIATNVILVGAIFRAVLFPADDRFAYLRVSSREMWMGLTILVVGVIFFIAIFAVTIPTMIGVFALGAAGGAGREPSGWGVLATVLLMLAAFGVVVWLMLRLSLAAPMSFAQNRFALFESWALTKGHALRLFLVLLAVMVTGWVIELFLGGLALSAMFAFSGTNPAALLHQPPTQLLRALGPALVVLAVLGSMVGMALYAIMAAPWAAIYRQLSPDPAAPDVFA